MARRAGYRYKKKSVQKTFRRKRYVATPSRALSSHNYMTKVVSDQMSLQVNTSGVVYMATIANGIGIYNYLKGTQFWTNLIEPAGATGITNTFNKMRIRKIQLCYCPSVYNEAASVVAGFPGGSIFEIALIPDRVPANIGVAADYNMSLIDNRKTFNQNVRQNQWATFYVPKNTVVTTTGYPGFTQDWTDTKFVSSNAASLGGILVGALCTGSFNPITTSASLGVLKILYTCDFTDFE